MIDQIQRYRLITFFYREKIVRFLHFCKNLYSVLTVLFLLSFSVEVQFNICIYCLHIFFDSCTSVAFESLLNFKHESNEEAGRRERVGEEYAEDWNRRCIAQLMTQSFMVDEKITENGR